MFVEYIAEQANSSAGYIMGATGEVLTEQELKNHARYQQDYSYEDYVRIGRRWMGRRVYDCNGLAEGCYLDIAKFDINTKARFNFSQWCAGSNGSDMSKMPQTPGVAVFMFSASRGYITHVGFTWRKRADGDWDIIEARGVKYGVVVTRLKDRSWNRWGLMTKYFEYGDIADTVDLAIKTRPEIKKGDKGEFVKTLQYLLMERKGYQLPKSGMDSDFGTETEIAVMDYQSKNNLPVTGIVNKATWDSLFDIVEKPADLPKELIVETPKVYPVIDKGDSGKAVKDLHNALTKLGYDVPTDELEDSEFGTGTDDDVKDFQAKNKLKVDGIVGKITWTALLTQTGVPVVEKKIYTVLKLGDDDEDVKVLQSILIHRQFPLRHGADGDFGPETERAVKLFQETKGLPANGIVDVETWKALLF